jgi:hypothetical protein
MVEKITSGVVEHVMVWPDWVKTIIKLHMGKIKEEIDDFTDHNKTLEKQLEWIKEWQIFRAEFIDVSNWFDNLPPEIKVVKIETDEKWDFITFEIIKDWKPQWTWKNSRKEFNKMVRRLYSIKI